MKKKYILLVVLVYAAFVFSVVFVSTMVCHERSVWNSSYKC